MPRFKGDALLGGTFDDSLPAGDRAMNCLWDWIMWSGGRAPKVKMSTSSVRTVVATENIYGSSLDGVEIFVIPIACLLYRKIAVTDEDFGAAFTSLLQIDSVDDRTALVFLLAIERMKGSLSLWEHYINSLPLVFPSPLGWSRTELLSLAGTRLEGASRIQHTALQQQIDVFAVHFLASVRSYLASSSISTTHVAEALGLVEQALTRGNLTWARGCVWSRAFSLFLDGGKSTVMLPLGDILDHSPRAKVEWLTDEDVGTISVVSHDNILAGNVIYNNYGWKSNEELILGYGFFLRSPCLNALHLQLAVDFTCPNQRDQGSSGSYHKFSWNKERDMSCYLTAGNPLPDHLVFDAQMHNMSSIELYHFMSDVRAATSSLEHTKSNTSNILTKLRALHVLSGLLTTMQERLARSKCALASCIVKDWASIRANVAQTSRYYRLSQLKIANLSLKALARTFHDEISRTIEPDHRMASASFKSTLYAQCLKTTDMTMYQEVDAEYRTWEADNGIQKHRMQDICSRSPLNLSFHGLCMTTAARNGDVLGKVPIEAILTASECLFQICTDVIEFEIEEVSLAATLMLSAINDTQKHGPFARWLLFSRTAAPGFQNKVLERISTASMGIEADKIREMYNSELAALQSAGMQLPVSDLAFLQELYARSRVMIARLAFRLPSDVVSPRDHNSRRLALIPFLGLFPRELIGIGGEFCLSYCKIESNLNNRHIPDWHLVLKASCTLAAHVTFCYPVWEDDPGSVLMKFGASPAFFDVGIEFSGCESSERFCGVLGANSVVEIQVEPRDDDVLLRQRKRNILHHTGLGVAHLIGMPPKPARLCQALAVCIAECHELETDYLRPEDFSPREGLVKTSVQSHQFRSAKNDVLHRRARNALKKILCRMLVDMPRQSTTSPADTLICENNWQVVEQSLSVGSVLEARRNVIIEWLYALGYKRNRR